jgi:hypothetical protein
MSLRSGAVLEDRASRSSGQCGLACWRGKPRMKPIPSCVVYAVHVDPDTGKKTGKITFQNVDVLADPSLALEVLQKDRD